MLQDKTTWQYRSTTLFRCLTTHYKCVRRRYLTGRKLPQTDKSAQGFAHNQWEDKNGNKLHVTSRSEKDAYFIKDGWAFDHAKLACKDAPEVTLDKQQTVDSITNWLINSMTRSPKTR